jgi:hypothetical protein
MTARLPSGRLSAAHVADRLRRLSGAAAETTQAIGVPMGGPAETVTMARPTQMLPVAVAESYEPPLPPRRRAWPWLAGGLVLVAAIAGLVIALSGSNNGSPSTGPASDCASGIPILAGRVETDLTGLTDLVCKGSISATASNALSPYLSQLAAAVKAKDVNQLDAVESNMSATIDRQQQTGHLTDLRGQKIADALTLFFSDATARLTKPTSSPSLTPSETPSETPSQTPSETPPPVVTPPTTPSAAPSTTPSSTVTIGL